MTKFAFAGALALAAAIIALSLLPARATTFNVLYKFEHPSIGYPEARVDLMNGNLYGTGAGDIHYGNGQVFELINSGGTWSETSADMFNETDGSTPYGGLIHDSSGDFYGTTSAGDTYGYGNVFYTFYSGGSWYLEKMWAFGEISNDGQFPTGDLVLDSAGNLYGTTQLGGAHGCGTVFEISPLNGFWTETILHNFCSNGRDGRYPYAGLLMDSAGNLYGTTINGGTHNNAVCKNGCGIAFELTQSGGAWKETVLHNFGSSKNDGQTPYGGLIQNSKNGVLYGTTTYGGAYSCGSYGCGTFFKLYRSKGVWKEKVLGSFTTNAAFPFAKLTWGSTTNTLYGTTNSASGYYGTVFKLTYASGVWNGTLLYAFSGTDGAYPVGAVIRDSSGNLYGTTQDGGDFTNCPSGCGTVWEITP